MSLLSFEGVSKHYGHGRGKVVVLDNVWLDVEAGDYVAVWGERRSGKSTLLSVAAGITRVDAGVVRFDGHDLAQLPEAGRARLLRDEIGFVPTPFDDSPGSRRMRVLEYVSTPLLADGLSTREANAMVWPMLERVDARHCADLRPRELSLGERTRVAIARGLIRQPRLLLVDEPAATPSPREQDQILALLRWIGGASDLTLIVASEEPAVLHGARRGISLSDGEALVVDRSATVVPFPAAGRRRQSPGS